MKKYLHSIFYVLLFLSCKDDLPVEPALPANIGTIVTGIPTMVTHPITDQTRYSLKITGSITNQGDSKVIENGFVVDTEPSATVIKNLNKFVRKPDQNGSFLAILINIPANKTYYIRSYGINQQGIGYGNEIKITSFSEKVFKGNVKLSTQQEVEDFGKEKYTTINGSLEITGSVTDLSPLNNLAVINYALQVRNTSQLATLKGMDSLEAVNSAYLFHGMRFENNKALISLKGLEKLMGNNGYLYIIDNDELTDLSGLDNIEYNHGGEIVIEGCDKLRSLHGIEKLNWLDGNIKIKDNPQLTDISSFSNLKLITWGIYIGNNASLQNVDGFEKLHKVTDIYLTSNKVLTNLNGFRNLDTISSAISIINNRELKDITCFEKITKTEYLYIESSPLITSLKGLQNINTVKTKIKFYDTGLTSLSGLENLKETKYIEVTLNRNLTNFCSLKPLLKPDWQGNGWQGTLVNEANAVNPSIADILKSCP